MSAVLALLFAGIAVMLVPGSVHSQPSARATRAHREHRRRRGARRAGAPGPDQRRSGQERAAGSATTHAPIALIVAAGCTALLCLAVFGPRTGTLAAAVCCPAVLAGVRWLQRRSVRTPPDPSVALTLDLAAAALRSGRPVAEALQLAAPAADAQTADLLRRVAGLAQLGADAEQAWSAVPRDGPLGEIAAAAVRSAASGIKLAAAFERLASELRAERAARAAVRAHRAGVLAMAPLAACFLPSFICLGVVPVIVGVARTAFGLVP